jgi:hypothetical protein
MVQINITHDGSSSNYDTLEAIGRWMLNNYGERDYKKSRVITVKSGKKLKVNEVEKPVDNSACSCSFNVETVKP